MLARIPGRVVEPCVAAPTGLPDDRVARAGRNRFGAGREDAGGHVLAREPMLGAQCRSQPGVRERQPAAQPANSDAEGSGRRIAEPGSGEFTPLLEKDCWPRRRRPVGPGQAECRHSAALRSGSAMRAGSAWRGAGQAPESVLNESVCSLRVLSIPALRWWSRERNWPFVASLISLCSSLQSTANQCCETGIEHGNSSA